MAGPESSPESVPLTGYLLLASNEEIRNIVASPGGFYLGSRGGDGPRREVRLTPGQSVVLGNVESLHWLLSGETPSDDKSGPVTPSVFLDRGGLVHEHDTSYVLEDGTRWRCSLARSFSPTEQKDILGAISTVDEQGLRRKGGDAVVEAWKRLCSLLAPQEASSRFVVAANVCMLLPREVFPIFNPPFSTRERKRGRHAKGELPRAFLSGGAAIGGEDFVGFGAGPSRAFSSEELATLDIADATAAMKKLCKAARDAGDGLVAYRRLANDDLYRSAAYWLRLGYFDREEVVDQLHEEFDEPAESIEMAVGAESAILALDRATWPSVTDCDRLFMLLGALREEGFLVFEYAGFEVNRGYELVEKALLDDVVEARPFCFFHQQCILRALDGGGLDLYFGEARRAGAGVDMDTSQRTGARIVDALTSSQLATDWDGRAEKPIVVRMRWQCRPRRASRSSPP